MQTIQQLNSTRTPDRQLPPSHLIRRSVKPKQRTSTVSGYTQDAVDKIFCKRCGGCSPSFQMHDHRAWEMAWDFINEHRHCQIPPELVDGDSWEVLV